MPQNQNKVISKYKIFLTGQYFKQDFPNWLEFKTDLSRQKQDFPEYTIIKAGLSQLASN